MKHIQATARTESGTDLGAVTLTEQGGPKRIGEWRAEIVFHDIALADPRLVALRDGVRLFVHYEGRDRLVTIERVSIDDVRLFVFCPVWVNV